MTNSKTWSCSNNAKKLSVMLSFIYDVVIHVVERGATWSQMHVNLKLEIWCRAQRDSAISPIGGGSFRGLKFPW